MGCNASFTKRVEQRLASPAVRARRRFQQLWRRRIGPQPNHQPLQDVADPAGAEQPPSLEAGDGGGVAGDHGETQVGTQ